MWGGRFAAGPSAVMEAINASIDFDKRMAAEDIAGSRAHAAMLARQGVMLGAVDSGQIMLAGAGVLDGYRAAVHWEALAGFRETYGAVNVTDAAYEIDRDRMTAATGSAAIDMMLNGTAIFAISMALLRLQLCRNAPR